MPTVAGVYISKRIRYAQDCSRYSEILQRHRLLSVKLSRQCFLTE